MGLKEGTTLPSFPIYYKRLLRSRPAQGGPCQWISSASTSALAQEVDQRHASKPEL